MPFSIPFAEEIELLLDLLIERVLLRGLVLIDKKGKMISSPPSFNSPRLAFQIKLWICIKTIQPILKVKH